MISAAERKLWLKEVNIVRHKTIYNLTCFPGMSNPPYGGVELPFLKGDLEGFLYEVMRDTINDKKRRVQGRNDINRQEVIHGKG